MKNIGKPCAGKSHARFDEGGQVKTCSLLYTIYNLHSLFFLGRPLRRGAAQRGARFR